MDNESLNQYTPDLYTLEDEEGNEVTFELLDVMDYNGETYFALTPYGQEVDEEEGGEIVVLKREIIDDEEMMVTIDDEEEYETVGNMFIERLSQEYEEDDLDDFPLIDIDPNEE